MFGGGVGWWHWVLSKGTRCQVRLGDLELSVWCCQKTWLKLIRTSFGGIGLNNKHVEV